MVSAFQKMLLKYQGEKLKEFSRNNQTCQVLFLGDSLIDLFDVNRYFALDCSIINRGISGITTAFLQNNLDIILGNTSPKSIFILIGTNDLGQGDSPLSVYADISELCSDLKKHYPEVELKIISILPTNENSNYQETVSQRTNERIEQLNQLLQGLENISFLDVSTSLSDRTGQLRKEYTVDGLHLSELGYQVFAQHLSDYLTVCKKE